jgi:predicted metal-dependent peptidase
MDINKRLSKAKTSLILDHPFIGTIAMNMPFEVIDKDNEGMKAVVPTAGTNGKRVIFNPDFIEPLSDDELLFLVAHECMHPMLEHNYRRHNRGSVKWNMAADYVINQLLVDDSVGTMPEGGCYDPTIYKDGGGTSDGIYNILPEQPPGAGNTFGKPGSGGRGWQDCEDAEGTQGDKDQQAGEWKVKVAQAAQASRMMGKMSANMERLVGEVLEPVVRWEDVLQDFVVKCRTDERSFARPSRRYITQGLYLPSRTGEMMGELVVAVDCSGSVGSNELNQFIGEVRSIKEDCNPVMIHVIYFDSEVCYYDSFNQDEELHMEPHGGGGTRFSPIFKYVEDEGIEPVACVVLTDLYCNDFGDQPAYPVLWVTYGSEDAEWGEVVSMKLKEVA